MRRPGHLDSKQEALVAADLAGVLDQETGDLDLVRTWLLILEEPETIISRVFDRQSIAPLCHTLIGDSVDIQVRKRFSFSEFNKMR